jgi:capsule polysaccharide export protein KpsE/RkpR
LEELEREQRLESGRIAELRRTLTTLQAKLEDARAASAPAVKWLREQERALQKLIGVYEVDLTSLDTARQLHQRLLKEIQTRSETVSLAERLQTLLETALAVWRYELIAVEDQPLPLPLSSMSAPNE